MKAYLLELEHTYSLEKKLGVVAYTDYKLRLMPLNYEILLQEQDYELDLNYHIIKVLTYTKLKLYFKEQLISFTY